MKILIKTLFLGFILLGCESKESTAPPEINPCTTVIVQSLGENTISKIVNGKALWECKFRFEFENGRSLKYTDVVDGYSCEISNYAKIGQGFIWTGCDQPDTGRGLINKMYGVFQ